MNDKTKLHAHQAAFNVNDYVWIKLNDLGRGVVHKPLVEDDEGWSKWPLWEVMQDFGPSISLGRRLPFDPEIRFSTRSAFVAPITRGAEADVQPKGNK